VLDAVGVYAARSLPVLRRGGTFVTILPGRSGDLAAEAERRGVRMAMMLVEYDHAGMAAIADLVASGQLRATIAGSFPLAEVAKAHELGETNRTAGKLVLTVR
jgi:NADPH:quinone reductase-like Zn-dependent oxidoreductase